MNNPMKLSLFKKNICGFPLLLGVLLLFGCSRKASDANTQLLQSRIDSLQNHLETVKENYKPELGEMMMRIQMHHGKLWFAGQNENWKLAQYEMHEITEMFDKIEKLHPTHDDQPIAQLLPVMIIPAIDSTSKTIDTKNKINFIRNFNILTSSCNNCHRATQHEFNVIKTPTMPPVTNQEFTPIQP